MHLSRPASIESVTAVLPNTVKFTEQLKSYIDTQTLPDHHTEPLDYVNGMDYLQVIEDFITLVNYELKPPTDSAEKGAAEKTPEH